jgi:GNAT superfamily N-acetyltransferase
MPARARVARVAPNVTFRQAAAMFAGIRSAAVDEGPELQKIEICAGEQFKDVGMADIAEHDPPSAEALRAYATASRSWVAVDEADHPIGYVLADEVDGNAHIEQVSVRPDHQGTGIGRALIDRVGTWAAAAGLPAVTLTTFADVAWNAPLYRHLGFRDLAEAEIGPQLRILCEEETHLGLDPATRVCMRRDLPRD